MLKLLQKRIGGKRGFTLIEIIVVLVILAILVAAAVPTMLGFVEDAKIKAQSSEARMIYLAAQAAATELEAKDTTNFNGATTAQTSEAILNSDTFMRMTKELGTTKIDTIKDIDVSAEGKVKSLKYNDVDYKFTDPVRE